MAELGEPERAARQLEQELNNIAGLIDQSSSPSGPTLQELIRKLDQVRTETRGAGADEPAMRALEARQVEMMDDLISRVQSEVDPTTLARTLQGLYASRDADEAEPRKPAAYSDYSSGHDSYRNFSHSGNEPPVFDGDDHDDDAAENDWTTYVPDGNRAHEPARGRPVGAAHQAMRAHEGGGADDYMSVPRKPVPSLTPGAPASRPEVNSGRPSPAAGVRRSRAVRRSVVVFVVVLILALIVAAALVLHH